MFIHWDNRLYSYIYNAILFEMNKFLVISSEKGEVVHDLQGSVP